MKFDLEKLHGAWKFKARLYLAHKGLWGVVEGSEVDAGKDEKAFAVIGLSVTNDHVVHIMGCETATEAWERLQKTYENASTANKMFIHDKFMKFKLEEGQPVQPHIDEMRRMEGQLATLGAAISNEKYKIALLRSLPGSYESLIVFLENMLGS